MEEIITGFECGGPQGGPRGPRVAPPHLSPESVMSNSISRTSWKCVGLVTLWLMTRGARKGWSSEGGPGAAFGTTGCASEHVVGASWRMCRVKVEGRLWRGGVDQVGGRDGLRGVPTRACTHGVPKGIMLRPGGGGYSSCTLSHSSCSHGSMAASGLAKGRRC